MNRVQRTRKFKHRLYESLLGARVLLPGFLALLVLAVLCANAKRYGWLPAGVCRLLGYPALVAMLIPYAYVLRRFRLRRYLGNMTGWMVYHIFASYAALGFALLHSQGRAGHVLTFSLMGLFWAVMVSGVGGFFGQRLGYRCLPYFVPHELGLERLEPERRWLLKLAGELVEDTSLLVLDEIRGWEKFCDYLCDEVPQAVPDLKSEIRDELWKLIPESTREMVRAAAGANSVDQKTQVRIVRELNDILREGGRFYRSQQLSKLEAGQLSAECQTLLAVKKLSEPEKRRLGRLVIEFVFPDHVVRSLPQRPEPLKLFGEKVKQLLQTPLPAMWCWPTSRNFSDLHGNYYLNVLQRIEPDQQGVVRALWRMVQKRREINREYRIHQLVHAWLWVHGPAAWALLLLVLAHVVSSIYYGGF